MVADVVVVVSTVATAAVVAWFELAKKHPENAASHRDEHPDTPADGSTGHTSRATSHRQRVSSLRRSRPRVQRGCVR